MPIVKNSSNISERGSLPESVGQIESEDEKLWSSLIATEGGEFITDAEEQRPGSWKIVAARIINSNISHILEINKPNAKVLFLKRNSDLWTL